MLVFNQAFMALLEALLLCLLFVVLTQTDVPAPRQDEQITHENQSQLEGRLDIFIRNSYSYISDNITHYIN